VERFAAACDGPKRALIRAAEYVRMSTEHQKYSTANQSAVIHAYAAMRDMIVVRTYADEGKSGLSLRHRPALRQLITDVQYGNTDFSAVIVYDVSRWGRFQDSDESGYYEYICKRAGITIHYCAEQFENDGSPLSTIIKNIKRAMASEYSRELSAKVFAGQSRLVKLGYRTGGSAPFGLRRLLIDQSGKPKGLLAYGERKSLQTDRIVLVPDEQTKIDVVRRIFDLFVNHGKQETAIARLLNQEGILTARGTAWAYHHVYTVLTHPSYIGDLVWNRQSTKLKTRTVRNDSSQWIRAPGTIEPMISRDLFERAQAIRKKRAAARTSREEKLQPLRDLLRKHGTLNIELVQRTPGVPSVACYTKRFGSLRNAFRLVGFTKYGPLCNDGRPRRSSQKNTLRMTDKEVLGMLRALLNRNGYLSGKMVDATEGIPSKNTYALRFGSLSRAFQLAGLTEELQQTPGPPRRSHMAVTVRLTDEELLDHLRALLERDGTLTQRSIDAAKGVPCGATYQTRFGSITHAYELIGYDPHRYPRKSSCLASRRYSTAELIRLLRKLLKEKGMLSAKLLNETEGFPYARTYQLRFGSLHRAYNMVGYKVKYKHSKAFLRKRRKC
jgi:DNA invertase Pin-like site-specific DNA recombinase